MNKLYSRQNVYIFFALALGVNLVTQVIASALLIAFPDSDVVFWLAITFTSVCLGLSVVVYSKLINVDFVSATTLNVKPRLTDVLWGMLATLGLIAVMIPVNSWIFDIIQSLGFPRPSVELPMQIVPLIICGSLVPAINEELVFRGVIGNGLARSENGNLKALLLSGLVFSLFHMNPAQTVHQFVLGVMLALLCYRSGSVWTSVIIHAFNNVIAVVLSFVVDESVLLNNSLWLIVGGLVIFVGATVGYFATTKQSTQPQTEVKTDGSSKVAFVSAMAVCLLMWIFALVVG